MILKFFPDDDAGRESFLREAEFCDMVNKVMIEELFSTFATGRKLFTIVSYVF